MKMLKNGLEADVFATSRIPILSPPSMKREVGPPCGAPPPERPAQVHHHHHAEDVAVAVAEPVADVREQKRYKNRVLPLIVPVPCVVDAKARWDANANAPRPDVDVR